MSLDDVIKNEILQKASINGRIEHIEGELKEGKNPYNPENIEFLLDYSGETMTQAQRHAIAYQLPERVVAGRLNPEVPKFKKKSEKELADTVAPVYFSLVDEIKGLSPEALITLAYESPAYEIAGNEKHNKKVKTKKNLEKIQKLAEKGDVNGYIKSMESKLVQSMLADYGDENFLKGLLKEDAKSLEQEFQIQFYDLVPEGDKLKPVYNPNLVLEYLKANETVAPKEEKPKAYLTAGKVYTGIIAKIQEEQKKASKP